jgi:hypothetical protein
VDKKENTIESLTALAAVINEKSDAAKLREVFGYIEVALSSGVRREKVLETIQETLGIKMNLKTFEKNLYRIRKKQKHKQPSELTKTSETINMGSQQLAVIPGITVTPPTSAMQGLLVTTQPNSVQEIENAQNHDNKKTGSVFKVEAWKNNLNGAEIYNDLSAAGHEILEKRKEFDREKRKEDNRLRIQRVLSPKYPI